MAVSANALRAGRAVIELGLESKKMESQLASLQKRLADRFKALGGLGGKLTNFGSFGIIGGGLGGLRNLFVGSAATAALSFPIKLAGNLEVAAAQLGVFVGGAANAKKILTDLMKFSDVSMLPFDELASTVSMLAKYGLTAEEAVASTKALSVMAAGSVDEYQHLALAFAQVGSAGRLQGEEMRQFKNTAFNPLREIAERTGETMEEVKKRMEAGGIAFSEVASALQAAVGPAGRFHGLLEKISNTMLGQMRKAWGQFKRAIMPLGEEVLKPITEFFRTLNAIIPKFEEFVKANAKWFNALLHSAAATAAAATAFVTIGLALGLVSIAMTGFVTVAGILSTAFFPILAIVGIAVLMFKVLGITLADLKSGFSSVFGGMIAQAKALLAGVKEVFGGIMAALQGGDFKLAGQILWAGLQTLFAAGIEKLQSMWITLKFGAIQAFLGLKAGIQSIWIDLTEWMLRRIITLGAEIETAYLRMTGQLTTERANEIIQSLAAARGAVSNQAARDRKELEKETAAAKTLVEVWKNFAKAASGGKWAEAKKRLDELIAKAKELAKAGDAGAALFPAVDFQGGLAGAMAEAKNTANPIATFDTSLIRQMVGAANKDELAQLKKIEKNTRQQRGGLPVV